MNFRGNEEDFERYYGDRKYKNLIAEIKKEKFTTQQKKNMLREILNFINEKNYVMYHDLMDDICESNTDWFNLLVFNKDERRCVLEYIRSKVRCRNK